MDKDEKATTEKAPIGSSKSVTDFETNELKVMHFDNQGEINFFKQQNQTIINEINMRNSNGIEALAPTKKEDTNGIT